MHENSINNEKDHFKGFPFINQLKCNKVKWNNNK
jgi:hypothetical protein